MNQIQHSVGFAGSNKPIDVAVVQHLLKVYLSSRPCVSVKGRCVSNPADKITVNGIYLPIVGDTIKDFQANVMRAKKPDGKASPNGPTLKKFIEYLPSHKKMGDAKTILFGSSPVNTGILTKVNAKQFRQFYTKQSNIVPGQPNLGLTITKGEDLLGFFDMLQNDPDIQDIRWAAYMLATVHKESQFSFLPVEENDKGITKPYGKKIITVVDAQGCRGPKNATYQNIYYGRGYCQLTLEDNYKYVGKALGMGDELYINPVKALEKKTAYKIMSYGMRHGKFTNFKLSDFINGNKCDYFNARQIINALDCADEIASYAKTIEFLLRICIQQPWTP